MSLEVNRMEPASRAAPPEAAQERAAPRRVTMSGTLRCARSGWVGALQLVTGLALLRWLGRGLLRLFGYRHEVTLSLETDSLDLDGERRLLGLSIGRSRRIIPLGTVRRARLAAESASWALLCGAAVIAFCAMAAGVLVLWGIRGRQPSWVALAVLVLGIGLLLDALAYLWARRGARQARATLEILTRHDRLRLCGVPQRAASELLDQLAGGARRG